VRFFFENDSQLVVLMIFNLSRVLLDAKH